MHILKIKIEGPTGSGKGLLERELYKFLTTLEDSGRIKGVLCGRGEYEIEVEVEDPHKISR